MVVGTFWFEVLATGGMGDKIEDYVYFKSGSQKELEERQDEQSSASEMCVQWHWTALERSIRTDMFRVPHWNL